MYEELCEIFGDNAYEPIEAVQPAAIDLNVLPPEEAVVEGSTENRTDNASVNEIVFISDSSDSSSSLWGYIEELLGSGSDADSVLPPGHSYLCIKEKNNDVGFSPSFQSAGVNSSSTSNPTPKKKGT
ncbi:hypothetical protein Salat_0839900 [Sesamum alatum]|uniref:Uncharacterized protein n=1 Tax=Sesamum alatum TaxID=300844 RepID=A0AAE1YIL8_9LAMI|nr:hypothetical protein Salat_0839900 [Sesamum alatum]